LRDSPSVHEHEREELKAILEWFDQNLKTPKRFNSSRSKGHYRRKTRGIAWFKDTSAECMGKMHRLKDILESHDHPVRMIRETRVGYIVYEDDLQVVAEPFSDTDKTGSARRRTPRTRRTRTS
jgi:hypothetical protein